MSEHPPVNTPGSDETPLLPGEIIAAKSEYPCPECGEMVRSGLVRCWNCGAFLKEEIASRYAEMQSQPSQVILSEVPEGEAIEMGDIDDEPEPNDDESGYELRMPTVHTDDKSDAASSDEKQPADSTTSDSEQVPHSVATGGDALLEVALSEERELRKRRKQRGVSLRGGARTPGGFVIFCPYGCRMEVKDEHRGMTGRCPKCRAPFIVPVDPPDYDYKARAAEAQAAESASPTGGWTPWMEDLHLHHVHPEKLKLKAGSLAKDYVEVDCAFGKEGMLIVSLAKKAGTLFGGGGANKKKLEMRTGVQQHLKEGKPLEEMPAAEMHLYKTDDLAQLRVVQPAINPAESMYAGIPVFGEHVVAVQMPFLEGEPQRVLSFGITQFRAFAQAVQEASGHQLTAPGVPLENEFRDYVCHYTDVKIRDLQDREWYEADPQCEVLLAGWKCGACGLTLSEEARKKEGLGGKSGKGIAKTKCPKCENKMGDNPLYTLASELETPEMNTND